MTFNLPTLFLTCVSNRIFNRAAPSTWRRAKKQLGLSSLEALPSRTRCFLRTAIGLLVLTIAAGCSSPHEETTSHPGQLSAKAGGPLRVGITPDYAPLVFEQGGSFAGAEIDLARSLGAELKRPVLFVSLKRDEQINALNDGRADIIMSGVSVTRARQLRASFSDPYLQNQLRAVFRRSDASKFQTTNDILMTTSRIGVLPGTTADAFVQKNCHDAQRIPLQFRQDAVFWLTDGRRIDLYIDDIFALAQIAAQNEATLTSLKDPLAVEDMAWPVSPYNTELLRQVNQILARWKSDGSLDMTLQRWMPYLGKR